MFEVYKFNAFQFLAFALILIRILTTFVTWPAFGAQNIPTFAKILTSLMLTFVLFPLIGWSSLGVGIETHLLPFLVLKEVFIGLTLGLTARLIFLVVTICGDIVSVSTGISAEQLYNPTVGQRASVIDQYYLFIATMIFFAIQGHAVLLSGLVQSFDVIPLSTVGISFRSFSEIGPFAQYLTIAGLKMAAPVFASLFLMNLTLGLLSRAAPQMNILVTSLAVNIMVGVMIVIVSLPLLTENLTSLVLDMSAKGLTLLKGF